VNKALNTKDAILLPPYLKIRGETIQQERRVASFASLFYARATILLGRREMLHFETTRHRVYMVSDRGEIMNVQNNKGAYVLVAMSPSGRWRNKICCFVCYKIASPGSARELKS